MKKIILAAALLTLAACGSSTKSGVTISGNDQGPATKELAKTTPNTLGGDTSNAQYSSEALKGQGMEDDDGK